ncbi:restriction endonuclease subunit S [Tenacibaculum mesophilum]|uniref:restriction endonuclease subunit S n=1 Tax=Tenacibaculum mesophilum TaxID=104268 RepID=UPI002491C046|nr:restriction endonuclease subunit S [Tenacibaculum mesophilum]
MVSIRKFGEVCDFVRGPFGGSLKKSCFVESGYAVYEQQHAIYNQFTEVRYFVDEKKFNEMKRFELKPNDLIMSCSGTMGKVAIVPNNIKKGIINQALLKLTPKDFLNVQYLKYWMNSPDFDDRIKENTVGAAIKNVASVKILKQIDVPIPPLDEQQQIVAILDQAFAAIDQAKANIEKNIENAKELFQSKLNQIFSQTGEGWEEKTLGEVVNIIGGGTPSKKKYDYYNGDIPWATVRDMNTNKLISTDHRISKIGLKNSSSNIIQKGNIIIATRVGLGKVCVLQQDTAINQDLKGLVPKSKYNILNEFIFWWYKSIAKKVVQAGTGATVQGVKLTFVKELRFPLAPLSEQTRVINNLNKFSHNISILEKKYIQKLNSLEELKKSILQKAFTGELTQKEIAI